MKMRLLIVLIAVVGVMILISSASTESEQPDGKLILTLNNGPAGMTVESMYKVSDILPVVINSGNTVYRIYSAGGKVLAKGKIHLQEFIVNEYVNDKGNFVGRREPFHEPVTISLPYFEKASTV